VSDNQFTMQLWICIASDAKSDCKYTLMNKASNMQEWSISMSCPEHGPTNLEFVINKGNQQKSVSAELYACKWYSVTATFDGSEIALFINGKALSKAEFAHSKKKKQKTEVVATKNWEFYIGRPYKEFAESCARVAELRMWNYALSSEDVFKNAKSLFPTHHGLVLWSPLIVVFGTDAFTDRDDYSFDFDVELPSQDNYKITEKVTEFFMEQKQSPSGSIEAAFAKRSLSKVVDISGAGNHGIFHSKFGYTFKTPLLPYFDTD